MSLPALNPDKTASGIIVDPRTLERVVPASRRSDGTERKERRIRPGFTPQEDVSRFRSTRAQIYDASKGVVPGATPKPAAAAGTPSASPMTKAQKKNEKRKEKRLAGLADEGIASGRNWDSDEDDEPAERARTREETPGPEDSSVEKKATAAPTPVPVLAPAVSSPAPDSTSAKPSDGAWRKASPAPVAASATAPSRPSAASPSAKATPSQPARTHTPRAGKGKAGPPGLAHDPVPVAATRTPPKAKVDEPRVRKEIRVRPGGVGMGLLSDRVRKLVIETQESPRRREGSPGTHA